MADGIYWQLAAGNADRLAQLPQQFYQGREMREKMDQREQRRSTLQSLALGPDGNLDLKGGITQMIRNADLEGATNLGQLHKAFAPEGTDEIKEYNLYRQQALSSGQQPQDFTNWKIRIKTASAPKINNVINNSENKYAGVLAENDAKDFRDLNLAGANAANRLNTITVMENLMKDPNFYSGFAGGANNKFNQALVSFGIKDAKAASPTEAFQALTNQLTLDATGGRLGAGISNADVSFLTSINPNLTTTPEGNRQIIEIQRKLAQRQQQVAQMAREYAKRNGGRFDVGFQDQLQRWAEANPLFPQSPVRQGNPAPQTQPQFSLEQIQEEIKRRNLQVR